MEPFFTQRLHDDLDCLLSGQMTVGTGDIGDTIAEPQDDSAAITSDGA